MPSKSELAFSRLLLAASTHHMRLTIEQLPVGMIQVSNTGVIESMDEWIESQLQFSARCLIGTSITLLFDDHCFEFIELMRKRQYGYLGQARLRTASGNTFPVELVLEESLQPHFYVFTVILGEECLKPTKIEK